MAFEAGEPVIRQVPDGPRQGVVQGLVRHGSTAVYYIRTDIGMVHCDPERRLRPMEQRAVDRG